MKLLNNLKTIIIEANSLSDIQDAVKNKKVVIINYNGDEYGKGYREIEPVCLGVSLAGNQVLRAWEKEGSSHSNRVKGNPIPGWRMFKLVNILTFAPTGDNFYEIRPGYNPNGDRSMASVIVNSVFDNEQNIT